MYNVVRQGEAISIFLTRYVTTRLKMLMREPHHQPGNPGILLAKLS
jgi:hypothetical protein